ncbi:ISL3 family transposase [Tsukamurella soli]|uniref:ISL3-like element IS31831 family transposase n=1 Tax=Tsukamurella soli TaxID=644556 RepID=A0ABP8KL99_9ACTN
MSEPTSSLLADTICRTVELGVSIVDAAVDEQFTHLWCRLTTPDPRCPSCGRPGRLRDHVQRELTDLPVVGHPTRLHVHVPRYLCQNTDCATDIFRANIEHLAPPRLSVTRRVRRWILQRLAYDRMSITGIARTLGISWNTVNTIALDAAREMVYADPAHLAGVRVLGVDEHTWKHVRGNGDPSMVTVIIDLTPAVEGTGPARLLDMLPGRSADVLTAWLQARDANFRSRIRIVAMDGFLGYHTASKQSLPQAKPVMDPFHVVHLAGEKVTACRTRLQQQICGHRGRKGDPLYQARRTLLTRIGLLTATQADRLDALFADDDHAALEATHLVYQQIIDAYAQPDRRHGKIGMYKVLKRLTTGLPDGLDELAQLGRSLWQRRTQILAFFDVDVSNGPTEAINGRLEHLRGIALGFRNLTHYILRSLIHSGQLHERINAL